MKLQIIYAEGSLSVNYLSTEAKQVPFLFYLSFFKMCVMPGDILGVKT